MASLVLATKANVSFTNTDKKEVAVPTKTPEAPKVSEIKLTIEYSPTEKVEFSSTTAKTPYDVLNEYSKSTRIPFDVKHYDFGSLVTAINGKANTKDLSWIYFVNGKSGDVAADKFELKPGDVVEWKYVKPIY